MGSELLVDGLTVGYGLALTQFLMVWGLTWWYLRQADREFDPLEEKLRALAAEGRLATEPPLTTGREA